MLLDRIASESSQSFEGLSESSLVCTVVLGGQEVLLAKPQTYMNRSGWAVAGLVEKNKPGLSRTLIVYDEVALPLGTLRFRKSGSSGGHKGMQSVIEALGTEDVPRLRIGIAGTTSPDDLSKYVLGKFKWREKVPLREVLERSCSAIDLFVTEGIERAMTLYN
jgi:PTH1 family peptidyl-tRNA hydrolase